MQIQRNIYSENRLKQICERSDGVKNICNSNVYGGGWVWVGRGGEVGADAGKLIQLLASGHDPRGGRGFALLQII